MFTIDLLNGKGIPIRCRPTGVAMVTFASAVPAIAAILLLSCFFSDRIAVSIASQQVANFEKRIGELSDSVQENELLKEEKKLLVSTLSEVNVSISRHAQWTPVLLTIVENLPASVVLTKLDVQQTFVKKKVAQKDDPKKKITVDVPVRKLHMSICGDPEKDCDQAVKDFRDRLSVSKSLAPRLEDITVSQRADTLDGRKVICYEINCIFKEGL